MKARWRTFAAPAAFLLATTIAIALVRPLVRNDPPARTPAPRVTTQQAEKAKPAPRREAARVYTVRAGDTLASIASRTGVSLTRLLALNPEVRPTSLFIGQRINLR